MRTKRIKAEPLFFDGKQDRSGRGRNGWFRIAWIDIDYQERSKYRAAKIVVSAGSKQPYRDMPPVYMEMTIADAQRLAWKLMLFTTRRPPSSPAKC